MDGQTVALGAAVIAGLVTTIGVLWKAWADERKGREKLWRELLGAVRDLREMNGHTSADADEEEDEEG